MSNLASPAARVIKQADDGIDTWLLDLVSGSGSSPSHIIVTGILGVVPGIGQAMDLRDIVIGVIHISKSPAAVGAWVEMVITLVGCVPAIGDALKVGFKLMKQGRNFGRVLEGVSPKLRGNVEQYMRTVNWGQIASESKSLFNKTLSAFIDGLDNWFVKAIVDAKQSKLVIDELKALQKQAPKMIDEAIAELKQMYTKMMGHELPGSTSAVAGTTTRVVREEAELAAKQEANAAARVERKLQKKKSHDEKNNKVQPNTTKNDDKKAAQPKKQKWSTGVPAEHITDYYVKKKHVNFRKANNGGKLTEEHSIPHKGLDHLWSNKSHITKPLLSNKSHNTKPFVVGETKSSIFDSFKLMAALPADLAAKFASLKADEAENLTANNKPNIFHSDGRDAHANQRVKVGKEDGQAIRRGVGKANEETGLGTQMSHKWIADALADENLTAAGHELALKIDQYRREARRNQNAVRPYQRWISLVTGRQLHLHQKSKGSQHDIQLMLDLPDKILLE